MLSVDQSIHPYKQHEDEAMKKKKSESRNLKMGIQLATTNIALCHEMKMKINNNSGKNDSENACHQSWLMSSRSLSFTHAHCVVSASGHSLPSTCRRQAINGRLHRNSLLRSDAS